MLKHIETITEEEKGGCCSAMEVVQLESFCEELCLMNTLPMQSPLLLSEFLKHKMTCLWCLKTQKLSYLWLEMLFHGIVVCQLNCFFYLCTGVLSKLFHII